jgi:hypothetical protein
MLLIGSVLKIVSDLVGIRNYNRHSDIFHNQPAQAEPASRRTNNRNASNIFGGSGNAVEASPSSKRNNHRMSSDIFHTGNASSPSSYRIQSDYSQSMGSKQSQKQLKQQQQQGYGRSALEHELEAEKKAAINKDFDEADLLEKRDFYASAEQQQNYYEPASNADLDDDIRSYRNYLASNSNEDSYSGPAYSSAPAPPQSQQHYEEEEYTPSFAQPAAVQQTRRCEHNIT